MAANGGYLGFDGHIKIIELASYSNMKEHIRMHLCAKFHACMMKCIHISPFCWTNRATWLLHTLFLVCIVW